jgi:hypothetical protein
MATAKIMGYLFIALVVTIMTVIYVPYLLVVWGPTARGSSSANHIVENVGHMLVLLLFNICVGMVLWSLIQTIITDPGKVPIYWVRGKLTGRVSTWGILRQRGNGTV